MTYRARTAAFLIVAAAVSATAYDALRSDRSALGIRAESGEPEKEVANRNTAAQLEKRFTTELKPFVERYCIACHGPKKQEAMLDLSKDLSPSAIARSDRHWALVLTRLQDKEMPPDDATRQPKLEERTAAINWLRDFRAFEAERHAGDPGVVLARRLSNAEFDNTIRDLTGVDIRPTREFPVDPANEAGFDNSGESLAMSPALLKKYLAAARLIADHVVLKPDGFVFAPHPAVTETDRDKYCVKRIIDFYQRHAVDLADYFAAAWTYRHRERLGKPATLEQLATNAGLSAKYLAMVAAWLNEPDRDLGPSSVVRQAWNDLPDSADKIRPACERMRDLVVKLRKLLKPTISKVSVSGISAGSQPLVLWGNRQLANAHRRYSGDVRADWKKLADAIKDDSNQTKLPVAAAEEKLRAALERFCNVFPDAFAVTDRGPYFSPNQADKGRPLTAGFHLMQGYFRDDEPLCELILGDKDRRELDGLWEELNFISMAPMRQYKDFIFFERAEPPRFMFEAEFDFARSEDKDAVSEAKMAKLAQLYLAKARKKGASLEAIDAIESYFTVMSLEIRKVERARLAAEPSHLRALAEFAERAYRRPLSKAEHDDLLAFYRKLRDQDDLSHEDALRDTIVAVLLSPHFCYRYNNASPAQQKVPTIQAITDYELASRLSYFLWSSMPDAELLAHAAVLHKPEVLKAQTQRMLRDPRMRGLATEFTGNWLDFRRFEEHNAVDRERFPGFTNDLRQAMFEEPVRYFMDVLQKNRSVLDLLHGNDTFVNSTLAKHYGMPAVKDPNVWAHVENAGQFGRGGLLPMAVFQTKNAPGLRTSPVKRGYWVVRRLLGDPIPPPPPTVPELPKDEAKLGDLSLPQLLAKHRDNKACAGCHQRFDSVGLVFEGFGPIGERRTKDLGGKPIETKATFPDGKERDGIAGLRAYLKEKRQDDFIDNLCRKLLAYALGRGLMLSDTKAIEAMKKKLNENEYRFNTAVEVIVTSPQFLNKRARLE